MKNKCYIFLMCIISILCFSNQKVFAKSIYFINSNGVSLSKDEYSFLQEFFWDDYPNLITLKEYNSYVQDGIFNSRIESVTNNNTYLPLSQSFSDKNKTLKISKVCPSDCTISITATWNNVPSVRSYDVMGAYYENTTLLSTPVTRVSTTSQTVTSDEMKTSSNGFGISFKIPDTGTNLVISQVFKVKSGGYVRASYQHAMSSISLSNSKNYTISSTGYGGVFKFSGVAADIYDRMSGVEINL